MKRFGIMSCNMYCNFTNYGSALQTYALQKVVNNLNPNEYCSIVMDYVPKRLEKVDILNPLKNMWDQDQTSQLMCRLSLLAIKKNNDEFNRFFRERYVLSSKRYTQENFEESLENEQLDGYICGSDTIFCIDEFGFDDGYYANFPCMKNSHTISYGASFGDSHFDDEKYEILKSKLPNFKSLLIRENEMIPFLKEHAKCHVSKVIDPTLLLDSNDYNEITWPRQIKEKYVLLYSRRYNEAMESFVDEIAEELGCKVVEISLRASNADKHIMKYDAGVEEFLSLIKHSEAVITNSFHGIIFAVQFRKPFYVFSREGGSSKIAELMELFGITGRILVTGKEDIEDVIDYDLVHKRIESESNNSLKMLNESLCLK